MVRMRKAFCLLLTLAGLAAAATDHPAAVAGIYEGTVAVKNADGRKIMLNLKQDGTSEFRDGAKSVPGQWSAAGQELRVQPAEAGAPMVWKIGKNLLTLREADKTLYGKKGLVLRRPR